MTRDQALVDATRAIRDAFPERADDILTALHQPSIELEVFEDLLKMFSPDGTFGYDGKRQFRASMNHESFLSFFTAAENIKRGLSNQKLLLTPEQIRKAIADAADAQTEIEERMAKVFSR